ncbi:hypothetical protein [Nitrosococcus wardiae]|uniref:hypothetical protein n=1 Tax=Nitrosococcus wardiae TaxID=1814290 RepID=UPI00141B1CDD|nr:hypothetical protein [Nitrosococcus wardiae]
MQYKAIRMVFLVLIVALVFTVMFTENKFVAKRKLYVSFARSDSIQAYIIKKGFSFLPVIYQKNIDPDNDGIFDRHRFVEYATDNFVNYDGLIALDWEGKAYQDLIDIFTPMELNNTAKSYIDPLVLLKNINLRKIETGYYGLPSKYSTRNNTDHKEKNHLDELYSFVDVLYPSLYLNKNSIFPGESIGFVKQHLLNALKTGCSKKKIYAFITHRWHPNSKYSPNALIPISIFEKYITTIKNTNHKGCFLDGIVWWGADEIWYDKKKSVRDSINKYGSIQKFIQQEIEKYANVIWKQLNE